MSRTAAVVWTVVLALVVSACEGPNCFAGECLVGPSTTDNAPQEHKDYFFDVVLGSDFGVDGMLRFEDAVDVRIHGSPTAADRSEVTAVMDDLRELTGRTIALTEGVSNLDVHFIPRAEFEDLTGEPGSWDGFFYVFYEQETGAITQAVALVATELPAGSVARRHVIRKMMTRGFGLLNASTLYPTSIFYHQLNTVTSYSPLDRFVIKTAYDPRLEAGMTRVEVEDALGW